MDETLSQSSAHSTRQLRGFWPPLLFLSGFVVLWIVFFEWDRSTPYIANGSDIIKAAKKMYEREGKTFPPKVQGSKISIFGDSKILTGFIPDEFDQLASAEGHHVYSFNSGFPGQDEFVGELSEMLQKENRPDIVLLTKEWQPGSGHGSFLISPKTTTRSHGSSFPFGCLRRM